MGRVKNLTFVLANAMNSEWTWFLQHCWVRHTFFTTLTWINLNWSTLRCDSTFDLLLPGDKLFFPMIFPISLMILYYIILWTTIPRDCNSIVNINFSFAFFIVDSFNPFSFLRNSTCPSHNGVNFLWSLSWIL